MHGPEKEPNRRTARGGGVGPPRSSLAPCRMVVGVCETRGREFRVAFQAACCAVYWGIAAQEREEGLLLLGVSTPERAAGAVDRSANAGNAHPSTRRSPRPRAPPEALWPLAAEPCQGQGSDLSLLGRRNPGAARATELVAGLGPRREERASVFKADRAVQSTRSGAVSRASARKGGGSISIEIDRSKAIDGSIQSMDLSVLILLAFNVFLSWCVATKL